MKISILQHFFFSLTIVFYLISSAAASESSHKITMTESTAAAGALSQRDAKREVKTHYGIGYEQRMKLLDRQARSALDVRSRPAGRVQRPVRPYRPQRPVRPGR